MLRVLGQTLSKHLPSSLTLLICSITDIIWSRTGKSRIMPLTFYPLSWGKKNSTAVWIRDHMCERFRVWFPGEEPSPYHWKIKISRKTTKMTYFILHLWTVYDACETYIVHPTSVGSITLTKTVPWVKVWSRLLVHLHIVCSFLTIHRVSNLKKYHAHRLKVMQFFLLIPLNVKLTVFITFMILLRWRKRLNTTGNWRLVNGTEQTE